MDTTIANTILEQIQLQDKTALSAWEAREIVALSNGVYFTIRTPLYSKGVKVIITLNSIEKYDIEVIQVNEKNTKVLKMAKDVYFDMLVEVLNELLIKDEKNYDFIDWVLCYTQGVDY